MFHLTSRRCYIALLHMYTRTVCGHLGDTAFEDTKMADLAKLGGGGEAFVLGGTLQPAGVI